MSLKEKCLPAKLSYAVSKNLMILEEEHKLLEENRLEICKRNALKDKEGNLITKKKGETEIFVFANEDAEQMNAKEIADLLEVETDITIHSVKPEDIEKCHASERYDILSVEQQVLIDFMIDE